MRLTRAALSVLAPANAVTAMALLLAFGASTPAHGQTGDTAAAGQRVKVLLRRDTVQGYPQQMLFGRLLTKSTDSLRLSIDPGVSPVTVSVRSVARIFVSRGVPTRQQSAQGGAIGGAVVGAGFGLLLMLFTDADVIDLLGHTSLDAALGATLGWLFPQESWKHVPR